MDETTNGCDRWRDRLSDYLDGGMRSGERGELEAHLPGCPACREVLDDLRAVKEGAAALGPMAPPRDLWPGIAARLGERSGDRRHVEGPSGDAGVRPLAARRGPGRRGIHLGAVQLAAAAVVGAWAGEGLPVAEADAEAGLSGPAALVGSAVPDGDYLDEVARLERALGEAREELDPRTVRVLEKNLAVIERAIRESAEALDADPGNPFVREHLRRSLERKRDYLRDAVELVGWSAA